MKKIKQLTTSCLIITIIAGAVYAAFGIFQSMSASEGSLPWHDLKDGLVYIGAALVLEIGILVLIRVMKKGKS